MAGVAPAVTAPAPKTAGTPEADTDLSGLLDTLRRNIKKIALATLLGFGLALAYLTIAKPVYTATASLFIDPRSRKVVSDELYQGDPTSALALVDSQMSIITSDTVLRRVVDKLDLDKRPEYTVQPGPGFIYKVKSLISPQPAVPAREASVQAIQTLNEGIKVKRAQKTYVVDIEASLIAAGSTAASASTASTAPEMPTARSWRVVNALAFATTVPRAPAWPSAHSTASV